MRALSLRPTAAIRLASWPARLWVALGNRRLSLPWRYYRDRESYAAVLRCGCPTGISMTSSSGTAEATISSLSGGSFSITWNSL